MGTGCAAKLVFSWTGNPGVGSLHRVRDAVERDWSRPLALEEYTHAAMTNAYDVRGAKLRVYIAAAGGCGIAGALYFLNTVRISPDAAFSPAWTAYLIFIVVIGGIGTIEGPIAGTLIYFLLRWALADYGSAYLPRSGT